MLSRYNYASFLHYEWNKTDNHIYLNVCNFLNSVSYEEEKWGVYQFKLTYILAINNEEKDELIYFKEILDLNYTTILVSTNDVNILSTSIITSKGAITGDNVTIDNNSMVY